MADFPPHEVNDISVKCQAVNPETKEASHSSGTVRVTPKISAGRPVSSRRSGFNRDTDKAHVLRNETGLDASPNKKLSDSLTVIIVTSVAVGGTVVIVLLGCMLYVWKRGRAKRFQGIYCKLYWAMLSTESCVYFDNNYARCFALWTAENPSKEPW